MKKLQYYKNQAAKSCTYLIWQIMLGNEAKTKRFDIRLESLFVLHLPV